MRRRRLVIGLVALGLLIPAAPAPVARAGETDELLPDLRAARTSVFRVRTTTDGRRLLRFTAQMINFGDGPMEIRANRDSSSSPWRVDQVVYQDDGSIERERTDSTLVYAGDGHDHWHVRHIMRFHLWSTAGTYRDGKVGFCFFDTTPRDLSLPGAPSSRVYKESTCGRKAWTSVKTGLSVGWGDTYPWDFAYQWIDITGLPGGTYTLRTIVDPNDEFREVSETNNCSWTRVRFGDTGTSVSVVSTGSGCIDDWSTTTFAEDIAWLFSEGITSGCDLDLFCTYNPVSRGQMATFLQRAMDLPSTSTDYFSDDGGSVHEPAINALAAAGLTSGCGGGRYCPDRIVSRGQMATFLSRALDLPASSVDHFSDDDGSVHEPGINAVADARLTFGCAPDRFCPDDAVVRGQMAAFLHRAFD